MRYQTVIKMLALLCACVLLCMTALGCGKARPIKGSDKELTSVGKVGAFDVFYEELRYLTLKYRDAMSATYGEGIWDDPTTREQYRAELEQVVFDNITANYAVLTLCAEVQISHNEKAIQDAVQDYIETMVEQFGSFREYKKQLAAEYLTDHLLRFNLAVSFCENELLYVYTDDLGLIADDDEKIYDIVMSEEFARTLHIYIENNPGESVEENRAKAESVLKELENGAEFNTLIKKYSEDFYMTTTKGYYFTHGEMVAEYEEAAFALEIGQFSDVVETPSGFYIIRRLEQDPEYVMTNLSKLIDQYQYAVLYNMIDARQDELTLALNEYGMGLDLTTIQ